VFDIGTYHALQFYSLDIIIAKPSRLLQPQNTLADKNSQTTPPTAKVSMFALC